MVVNFYLDQHGHFRIKHKLQNCFPWFMVYGHGSFCWANVFTFGMWPKTFQGQWQHLVFLDDTLCDPLLPNGQCQERIR